MMSLPDFKEKQLLIVTASDVANDNLRIKNQNICLTRDGKIVNQLSCHKVFALWIVGDLTLTSVLIRKCQQYGVSLFLLRDNFLQYSSLVSIAEGNYLLREKQYEEKNNFTIAKHLVANKLLNQQILLNNVNGKKEKKQILKRMAEVVDNARDSASLLGVEGSYSKDFFTEYFGTIGWYRRMPRAKVDEINVLMDMGYTMLFNFVDAMLGLYGFDTYKGVYHTLFFQRKSLVCDLVEPFRCVIDKQILKSFNLNQINKDDFIKKQDKYLLSYKKQQKYVRIFSEALMTKKQEIFLYIRDYYYCIMNDTDKYPVFLIR